MEINMLPHTLNDKGCLWMRIPDSMVMHIKGLYMRCATVEYQLYIFYVSKAD